MDASAYLNRLDNMIRAASTSPAVSDFIPGGDISFTQRYENVGKLVSYGGDLTVEYFTPTKWGDMNIWANYSYVDGKLDRTDSSDPSTGLPLTAKHKVKAGATLHYKDWLTVTPMMRWIDNTNHYSTVSAGSGELRQIPSYFLVDLHASAKIHDQVTAYVTVENLLDRRYYNAGGEGGTANPVAMPQDALRLWTGLRLEF